MFAQAGGANGRARSAGERKVPRGDPVVHMQVQGAETNFAIETRGPGTSQVRRSVRFQRHTCFTRNPKTPLKGISTPTLKPKHACAARKKRSRPGGRLQVVRREQAGLLRHVTRAHAARVRLRAVRRVRRGRHRYRQGPLLPGV